MALQFGLRFGLNSGLNLGLNNSGRLLSASMDFESGSSQTLTITDANQVGLDITGSLTMEAWLKRESAPGASQYLMTKRGGAGQFGWRWQINPSNSLVVDLSQTGAAEVTCACTSANWDESLGVWSHLAFVFNAATGDATFYQNGVQVGTPTATGLTALFNNTAAFNIASFNSTLFMDGLMADVRVWSVARSQAQIAANYRKIIDPLTAGLQGNWLLDTVLVGGLAKDHTPNTNDLTLVNAPVFSTDVPF